MNKTKQNNENWDKLKTLLDSWEDVYFDEKHRKLIEGTIKEVVRYYNKQALEEGKRIGRKEVIEKTKNLIKEEFPKFEGNPEDDIRRERYEIGPDEECIKFCDDVYEMCRKKALSLLTHLNKDE